MSYIVLSSSLQTMYSINCGLIIVDRIDGLETH